MSPVHRVVLMSALATGPICISPGFAQEGAGATPSQTARRGLRPPVQDDGRQGPPGYDRRHALVIGIDDYADPAYPDLGFAVADARAVAQQLVERFAFEQDHIRLLLDGDATKQAVDRALEEWASDPARVGEEDLLVIFFAGHGVTRDLGDRGSRGYLVPADGRADGHGNPAWGSLTGMNFLEDVSEAIPAKHALFLLDCCFGGLAVSRAAPPVAAGLGSRARQVITAGSADQTVLDAGGRAGHSVFTGAILDGFDGRADLDGDSVVTFGELFNHVGRDVQKKTGDRQTPLQTTFADHEGGSVALFPPGLEPGRMNAADRLKEMARTSDQQLAELRRLSDVILVDQLIAEADLLYPSAPEREADHRNWLARARSLIERRRQHEQSVVTVRQEAYLTQVLAGVLDEGDGTEPLWEQVEPALHWRFQTFSALLARLDLLEQQVVDVERRLSWALRIDELTLEHPNAVYSWEEAREAIAMADGVVASELYREQPIDLTPQRGLVPIGMNPVTGLWEFYHLRTAWDPRSGIDPATLEIPEHEEDGTIRLNDDVGIVFVLIPGGTFWMGAQKEDPAGMHFDPQAKWDEVPVHSVLLDAYFMSRYEMTQGQWIRVTGNNPSMRGPGISWHTNWDAKGRQADLTHPVEQISWDDCMLHLGRVDLTLPTEAQWETACRAGTTTAFWTGATLAGLDRAANLSDRYSKTHGNESWSTWEEELDDGSSTATGVGRYQANAFGLHDTSGNLWEWCLDRFDDYARPGRPGDGARLTADNPTRIRRGGAFHNIAEWARSAYRMSSVPGYRYNGLGCRAARPLKID